MYGHLCASVCGGVVHMGVSVRVGGWWPCSWVVGVRVSGQPCACMFVCMGVKCMGAHVGGCPCVGVSLCQHGWLSVWVLLWVGVCVHREACAWVLTCVGARGHGHPCVWWLCVSMGVCVRGCSCGRVSMCMSDHVQGCSAVCVAVHVHRQSCAWRVCVSMGPSVGWGWPCGGVSMHVGAPVPGCPVGGRPHAWQPCAWVLMCIGTHVCGGCLSAWVSVSVGAAVGG